MNLLSFNFDFLHFLTTEGESSNLVIREHSNQNRRRHCCKHFFSLLFLATVCSTNNNADLPLFLFLLSSQGFDEYMNVVIDDAEDINVKKGDRRHVGKILLKGDCITLIQRASGSGLAPASSS